MTATMIVRRSGREPAPLSPAQSRAWILQQMDPGHAPFNRPLAVRLKGPLDCAALSRSVGEIVRRHEILRTIFAERNGKPVQVVLPAGPIDLSVRDLERLPVGERECEARRIASAAAQCAFDLERGPLVRSTLLRLAPENHVLLLMMHHIVFDGWSEGILLGELGVLYAAYSEGRPSPLPEPPLQYSDFAVWQQKRSSEDVLDRQLAYWRRQLQDIPSALALPTDFPRANASTSRGGRRSFTLRAPLTDQLAALARGERVTLFMVLLAAFQVLLGRYASQEDVLVGVPTAGRTHAETEGLLGCFMNVLVLRTDLSRNPTFRALLGRVRETALRAYAHQEVPFERLVEALRPPRDPNRWPLFQVMFNMHVLPKAETAGPAALSIEPFPCDSGFIGGLDLSFRVDQLANGLACTFAYAADLYLPDTIDRMTANFQTFLAAAVGNPDETISALPLLDEAERQCVLFDWNRTEVRYPTDQCIHQLFEAQARRSPDAVAVEYQDDRLTYAELDRRANRLAHRLRRLGVGPESQIALCVHRSPQMVIGILGILKAGGAYVPLDPTYPVERLAFMIGDAGATIVLTQNALARNLRPLGPRVVEIDDDRDAIVAESGSAPESGVAPGNAAYVMYTSGSTGKAKGVVICHGAVCNHLYWRHDYFRLTSGDRLLQTASFSFDDSVWEFFEPLTVGACVVMMRRHDVTHLASLIAGRGITAVCLVPSLLRAFLDEDVGQCTRLRRVTTGGETLPVELVERFFTRLDVELHNGYGPTEATVAATFWQCKPGAARTSVPIGRPIANTRVYVLDSRLEPMPIGVPGELYIGGVGLARGYLNAPELTADRFVADPFAAEPRGRLYKTGDLARYLPDGNLEFLGRLDDQIKLRGFRIEPGEIEAALRCHPAVREAVVIARDDRPPSRQLVAYVVARRNAAPSTSDLRTFLATRLPDYMVPSAFVVLDAMPRGQHGKIDRLALPPPDRHRADVQDAFVAPRSALEQALATLWSRILGLERVGVHDNFFELGGHSLLATQVISRMRTALHVELSLRSFFETPTIAAIAAAAGQVNNGGATGTPPDMARISRRAARAKKRS